MKLCLQLVEAALEVISILLSTQYFKAWFKQLDHRLEDEILDGGHVLLPILSSLLDKLRSHDHPDLLKALVSLLHLAKSSSVDLLGLLDVLRLIQLGNLGILVFLELLAPLEHDVVSGALELALCQNLDLKCFLMGVLSKHPFHLEGAHVERNIRPSVRRHILILI